MLGTAEKIEILKRVSIFAELSDKILAEVAALVEEVEVGAGQTIFEKGERGYCMYIVVSGRMCVQDGARVLNYLESSDVFGEMAALIPEPRLASVSAVEDTLLLRLYQRPLYRLMAEQSKVAQGVIFVLCERLRDRVQDLGQLLAYRQTFTHLVEVASEVQQGVYAPEQLKALEARPDEVGQLARSLRGMLEQVQQRDARLSLEIQRLKEERAALKKIHLGCQ